MIYFTSGEIHLTLITKFSNLLRNCPMFIFYYKPWLEAVKIQTVSSSVFNLHNLL